MTPIVLTPVVPTPQYGQPTGQWVEEQQHDAGHGMLVPQIGGDTQYCDCDSTPRQAQG